MNHFIIVGAGPAGLALAMNLSQNKNRKITILEKSFYPGGSWKSYFLNDKYFCEHSPQVVFSTYQRFFNLLKILKINRNEYTVKTDSNIFSFYLKMSKFVFKYFNIFDILKLIISIIKKKIFGTDLTLKEVIDKYNFSKGARKGLTMLSLAVADIPEKVLFKHISFTNSGYLLQLKDKNLFVNKMVSYLKKRNVNLLLNSKVVELTGNKKIKTCYYIKDNFKKSIDGDEFIIATPPVPLYNIIKSNKLTKNNWKPIKEFKKWANYSSYFSIAFQLHFTEKIKWKTDWGWTINTPWYIITLPISDFISDFSRDPDIKTVWSCTIIDGNYKSPRLNKTTNQCTLKEIEEEVVYQLSQEYGKKLKPKVVTFNPSVKIKDGKYVSSGSGAVITKLGKLDFKGKIKNLSTIGCHTMDNIANLELALESSMEFSKKYFPNDKILLKKNDCNKKVFYLILIIFIYLLFKRIKISFFSKKK